MARSFDPHEFYIQHPLIFQIRYVLKDLLNCAELFICCQKFITTIEVRGGGIDRTAQLLA